MAGNIDEMESRIGAIEARLLAEMDRRIEQAIHAALRKVDRAVEERIVDRLETLEKAMLHQSSAVTTLRQRVERLFERAAAGPDTEAPKRQPEIPEPRFEPGFRPQILKEEGKDPTKRRRVPLTKL